jgi:hypothetical protein
MAEYDVARLDNVLVQSQGPQRSSDQLDECALALFDRRAAQVFAGKGGNPSRPKDKITLRQGVRVMMQSWTWRVMRPKPPTA